MMDDDIDVEWIGYHHNADYMIRPTTLVTTPYDIYVRCLELYYRVSHPRLLPPHQDALREVSVPSTCLQSLTILFELGSYFYLAYHYLLLADPI